MILAYVAVLCKNEKSLFFCLQEVAASFCFSSPPKVLLKIHREGDGYRSKREPVNNKFNRGRGGRPGGKTKFERY